MSKPSVAIFGLNGTLGAPTLNAIQTTFADKFLFPVLAVTRDTSKVTSTDKVKYIKGDYINGTSELAEQLKGTDVIIELVSPNPELFAAIETIVRRLTLTRSERPVSRSLTFTTVSLLKVLGCTKSSVTLVLTLRARL